MKNTSIAISFVNHNASACVMVDNNVELFIQAERVTREKNGQFVNTSNFQSIIDTIGTNQTIDTLILADAPNETIVKEITAFFLSHGIQIKETKITKEHHLLHALGGFYMSGFSEASVLVVDAWGQSFNFDGHMTSETTSLYEISTSAKKITCKHLFKQFFYNHILMHHTITPKTIQSINDHLSRNFECPTSISSTPDIGLAYTIISNHLGFGHLEEGKTMGLSNYGVESHTLNSILTADKESRVTVNPEIFLFERSKKILNTEKFRDLNYYNFQEKANIAHAIQKSLEIDFKQKLATISNQSQHKNVVITGGCALNVINNTFLENTFPDYNFFVDPIANDASISLGACLFYSQYPFDPQKTQNIYWGPKYTEQSILAAIEEFYSTNNSL